jgi:putative MATE family efflux protein
MKVNATYRNIWEISYPIILGSLATTVLNLTDTAFIARVGETELGAMALATVYYFLIVMIGIALGTGAQIIMSRRAGEGDHREIGRLFDHSFILLSGMAVLFFLLSVWFSPHFFSLILHSENILAACNGYTGMRSYGFLVTLPAIAFRSFYIGIGQTRIITYSALIMTGLNIILDYTLIFGRFGFPAMGMNGAALASVIAEIVAFIYLILYSAYKHEFRHFSLFRFAGLTSDRMQSIVRLASPVMVQNMLSMSAWFLFFVFIEHMGEHELAISNIIRATYMILMTPIWGYASAANSMVSNLVGQSRHDQVKILVKKIIHLSMFTTAVIFLVSMVSPAWLLRITTSDEVLIADSLGCYYIIIGAMFLFSVSVVLLSTVSGLGSTKAAMGIEIVNIVVYLVYVYLCVMWVEARIEWVWFSEILYWTLMGSLSFWYLQVKNWRHIHV